MPSHVEGMVEGRLFQIHAARCQFLSLSTEGIQMKRTERESWAGLTVSVSYITMRLEGEREQFHLSHKGIVSLGGSELPF